MVRQAYPALEYIRETFAREDALLARVRESLEVRGTTWQVGADEGRLLQLFMRMNNVKTVVEIGTLAGYSTLWMARALPEGGHIHTIEKDATNAALARKYFKESEVADRISLYEGIASDMLIALAAAGPYDMIFIDADKGGYSAYLDWAESNIRKGGLIVGDNTLLFGAVTEPAPSEGIARGTWEGMKRFNSRLADPARYDGTMVPTEQGMTVAVKLF
jgi:predicted O-methyltransferase YrrM